MKVIKANGFSVNNTFKYNVEYNENFKDKRSKAGVCLTDDEGHTLLIEFQSRGKRKKFVDVMGKNEDIDLVKYGAIYWWFIGADYGYSSYTQWV